jgi:hypothetical protein
MHQQRASDRRMSRRAFHYPERRSGFDRRREGGLLCALRDNPSALLSVLIGLNAMSAADWALTSHALAHGATEGNAVMSWLIATSPAAAGTFKAACALVVSAAIWRGRRYRLILATAVGGLSLYGALLLYQLAGLLGTAVL